MTKKLSIIILSWNTLELTRISLQSVYHETTALDFEVLVIDNASTDGSQAMIKKEFPQVVLVENKENLGFGKGNNQGFALAQGEYLMCLNSDVLVLDRAIEKLVAYLDTHPSVVMIGPKLLNADRTFQSACRRTLPDPLNAFIYLFGLSKIIKIKGREYKRFSDDENQTGPTEALSGSAMMFRRRVYETIGGFDERFFMYGEDLDFCKQTRDRVGEIVYLAEAEIIHYGGASSKKRKTKSLINFHEAMWLYYKKNFSSDNILIRGLVWLGIKLKLAIALILNGVKRK